MNNQTKDRLKGSYIDCHGLLGNEKWPKPYCVAKSDEPNRKDQGNMTDASEYLDEQEVLEAKIEIIAKLIKNSKCVTAYTGAGLSRAAGIGDYASKAKNSIVNNAPKLKSAFDAKPTYAHNAIAKLEEAGLLHHYVQQNHDGLPQKAGFPQEKINEIHGAWYDPSNPVVQFSESLRSDLFNWMEEMEHKTDLTLCLGTSLSGMNADRCAWTPAKKFKKQKKGNGTIMINLQKTEIDSMSTIRVWAKLDDCFSLLMKKLDIDMSTLKGTPKLPKGNIFYIPYDENGKFLGKDAKKLMKLDFSVGSKIRIVHPDSSTFNCVGDVYRNSDDHYSIYLQRKNKKPSLYALGHWWIDCALRGVLEQFPYANEIPEFVEVKKEKIEELSPMIEERNFDNVENEINFVVGNTHKKLNEGSHLWKVFITEKGTKLFDSVKFTLHPTFKDNEILIKQAPFELERTGWGTFEIDIVVNLKNGKSIDMKHNLSFNGSGVEKPCKILI